MHYSQVKHFVQSILHKIKSKVRKSKCISKKLASVYSKIPEDTQTESCETTLDSWRELTKNDLW